MTQSGPPSESSRSSASPPAGASTRSPWLAHGFLNTLEHVLTRGLDALNTMVLVWLFPVETFSTLAVSQALIAPFLLVFVSPANSIYRDYADWKNLGLGGLVSRLRAMRIHGAILALLAFVIAAGIALSGIGFTSVVPWEARFWALAWAMVYVTGLNWCGADREFLRLELQLKFLNQLTFVQKFLILLGTVWVGTLHPERIDYLAFWVTGVMALSTLAIRIKTFRLFRVWGASPEELKGRQGPPVPTVIWDVLKRFSLWQHISGVILGWVQTMDLFFLGIFRFPPPLLGLYGAALKLANFSIAIPLAFSNLFQIWLGRKLAEGSLDPQRESREVSRLTLAMVMGSLAQAAVLILIAPYLIELLSRGKWALGEQETIEKWFQWIVLGAAAFNATLVLGAWMTIKGAVKRLLWGVYLPWLAIAAVLYGVSSRAGGPDAVAMANIPVGLSYAFLLIWQAIRFRSQPKSPGET